MASLAYVDLTELPEALATLFTIDEFTAGVLITIGVLALIIIPLIILTKGEIGFPHVVFSLLVIVGATVLGWLDAWVLLLLVLITAVGFGVLARGAG